MRQRNAEKIKIMVVLGTRPEATKLAPVVLELRRPPQQFEVSLISTGQHREMLLRTLAVFGLKPDRNLNIMLPSQSLEHITSAALTSLQSVFEQERPDLVLVEGDTTTVFAASLAAFYHQVPVAHLEAGLRTQDIYNPFPEEMNRRLTSVLSRLHLAPTQEAKENLLKEGHSPGMIYVTGNTAVDALLWAASRPCPLLPREATATKAKKLVLVTTHRRESWGKPMQRIFSAFLEIVRRFPEVEIIFPVHLNPKVREAAGAMLSGAERIHLLDPVDYLPFVHLMKKATLILTDSGGIQEEAPSLGKPILVLREKTERGEGIASGTARLVGTNPKKIMAEASRLLSDKKVYKAMAGAPNPFGDGKASERVRQAILHYLGKRATRPEEFGRA